MGDPRTIFVTVGSQMPFERLVAAVDAWHTGLPAPRPIAVFGQVGHEAPGRVAPRSFDSAETLPSAEYERRVAAADLVVAHAGTGTIFTALRHGTPLLVLARRADLGETRNDHQEATAARFEARGLLEFARDERDLATRLEAWRARWAAEPGVSHRGPTHDGRASDALIARLRGFFDQTLGARR